jgi:hypothetical protein
VDFTTSFKNAVSLGGSWGGNDFNVYARFYNNNTLTVSRNLSASFEIDGAEISGGEDGFDASMVCWVTTTIDGATNGGTKISTSCNASSVWSDGYDAG